MPAGAHLGEGDLLAGELGHSPMIAPDRPGSEAAGCWAFAAWAHYGARCGRGCVLSGGSVKTHRRRHGAAARAYLRSPPPTACLASYRFGALQPAASASATEQNQRFPLLRSMFTLAYQRPPGS
jgi:hypothetical protein